MTYLDTIYFKLETSSKDLNNLIFLALVDSVQLKKVPLAEAYPIVFKKRKVGCTRKRFTTRTYEQFSGSLSIV